MATASTTQPPIPQRTMYGSSMRLPDRTINNNPPPFGQSLSRKPEPQSQFQQLPPARGNMEKEGNALNELSDEQREEINEAFSLFDLDRDRHLDYHELRVALRALGFSLPKPEILDILKANGTQRQATKAPRQDPQAIHPTQLIISQQAFMQIAAQKVVARDPREEIDRAFDLFDSEQKGFIDLEDLRRVARELGETGLEEDELRAMIDEFDPEGKGGVDREGFLSICLQ